MPKLVFKAEAPLIYLHNFSGNFDCNNTTIPLNIDNFLHRGASLKNTEYIIGLVIYTGYASLSTAADECPFSRHETKIMLNSVNAHAKQSTVESYMSKLVVYIFITQVKGFDPKSREFQYISLYRLLCVFLEHFTIALGMQSTT